MVDRGGSLASQGDDDAGQKVDCACWWQERKISGCLIRNKKMDGQKGESCRCTRRMKLQASGGREAKRLGKKMQKTERAGENRRGQAGTSGAGRRQGGPARLGVKGGPMLHAAYLISLPASVPRLHLARQSLTGFIRWVRGYRWMAVG